MDSRALQLEARPLRAVAAQVNGPGAVFLQHLPPFDAELFQGGPVASMGRDAPVQVRSVSPSSPPMQDHDIPMPDTEPVCAGPRHVWRRRLPFLALVAAGLLAAVFLHDQLTFDALARHREELLAFRDANYVAASLGFIAIYVAIVALSLPGGTIATLTGGFLFGLFPGVLYNVTGATLGALLIFLTARSGFGDALAEKLRNGGGTAARLMERLRENEWSVLFLMRLVPVVPFVLANLIPAFTGTRLSVYATTTFLGIIPAALVFTSVGSGLGEVFARGETPDLDLLFTPPILLPIVGLAALAALPIVVKAMRKGS